jgi:hypothetical protein
MAEFLAQANTCKPHPAAGGTLSEARVQDVFILALGAIAVIAPWFNGEAVHPRGALFAQSLGVLICVVALWGIGRPRNEIVPYLGLLASTTLACAPVYTRGVPLHHAECAVAGALALGFAMSAVIASRRLRANSLGRRTGRG